jgi:hypothetical protein
MRAVSVRRMRIYDASAAALGVLHERWKVSNGPMREGVAVCRVCDTDWHADTSIQAQASSMPAKPAAINSTDLSLPDVVFNLLSTEPHTSPMALCTSEESHLGSMSRMAAHVSSRLLLLVAAEGMRMNRKSADRVDNRAVKDGADIERGRRLRRQLRRLG